MDINVKPGTKVKFNNFANLFVAERKKIIDAGITRDSILTVKNIDMCDPGCYVCFDEVEGRFHPSFFERDPSVANWEIKDEERCYWYVTAIRAGENFNHSNDDEGYYTTIWDCSIVDERDHPKIQVSFSVETDYNTQPLVTQITRVIHDIFLNIHESAFCNARPNKTK